MRLELMTKAWKAPMLPLHQWHACTDFFNLGFQESVNLGFQISYSVAFRNVLTLLVIFEKNGGSTEN